MPFLGSVTGGDAASRGGVAGAALLGLLLLVGFNGFVVVQPNQAKVAVFLGRYLGTITWQVQDAAQAAFDVESYQGFVTIQAETAVRHVASVFPYDSYEEGQESLRGATDRVIATLQAELQERLRVAGLTVLDTRLRRLASAPEIAADMLRRQQADAAVPAAVSGGGRRRPGAPPGRRRRPGGG